MEEALPRARLGKGRACGEKEASSVQVGPLWQVPTLKHSMCQCESMRGGTPIHEWGVVI
jgi:hypothetical protein